MKPGQSIFARVLLVGCGLVWLPSETFAGAAGPSVGNPNTNEAAEEPEPRSAPMMPTTGARKFAAPADYGTRFYATIEAKHVTSDYFDRESRRVKRDPALHGRLQFGSRLYGDRLDLSIAGGAVKLPASQMIYQKRPELLADVYPIKTQFLKVLWYNMLQFPIREEDRDPTEFSDADLYDRDSERGIDSTVFTSGLAPIAKIEWRMWGGRYSTRVGADAWTKLYTKPLYVDETNEAGKEGVGLVKGSEEPVDKRFEDRAMRYVHQESAAVGFVPAILPSLALDFGAHIESRYMPQYYRDDSGGWAYTYFPERRSFWRSRVHLDITQTWSFENEFDVFRNGFFKENRVNDERRYRNVVKIAAKL